MTKCLRDVSEAVDEVITEESKARQEVVDEWIDGLVGYLPAPFYQRKYRELLRKLRQQDEEKKAMRDADTTEAFVALGGQSDRSGEVQSALLRRFVKEFGLTIDINSMIAEFDTDNSGLIDFSEFKAMFAPKRPEPGASADDSPLNEVPRLSRLLGDVHAIFGSALDPEWAHGTPHGRPGPKPRLLPDNPDPQQLPDCLAFQTGFGIVSRSLQKKKRPLKQRRSARLSDAAPLAADPRKLDFDLARVVKPAKSKPAPAKPPGLPAEAAGGEHAEKERPASVFVRNTHACLAEAERQVRALGPRRVVSAAVGALRAGKPPPATPQPAVCRSLPRRKSSSAAATDAAVASDPAFTASSAGAPGSPVEKQAQSSLSIAELSGVGRPLSPVRFKPASPATAFPTTDALWSRGGEKAPAGGISVADEPCAAAARDAATPAHLFAGITRRWRHAKRGGWAAPGRVDTAAVVLRLAQRRAAEPAPRPSAAEAVRELSRRVARGPDTFPARWAADFQRSIRCGGGGGGYLSPGAVAASSNYFLKEASRLQRRLNTPPLSFPFVKPFAPPVAC
ncbi:Dynein 18 kDa light chain [Diplonema papillatum]|nr:Dynein 18 kDa light chain [Diplonema papillatum]